MSIGTMLLVVGIGIIVVGTIFLLKHILKPRHTQIPAYGFLLLLFAAILIIIGLVIGID